ncbi:MAG: hypothetical protein LBT50_10585 [Prevotellaceae bacterium]|nr:hypothetical protein [Prevotellaceae bacterium]
MQKILTSLFSKASFIAALFAWNRVFLPETTRVLGIWVSNSTPSDRFDGQTRFKNSNDIWWFCKNNLDNPGGFPIFPLLRFPCLVKELDA